MNVMQLTQIILQPRLRSRGPCMMYSLLQKPTVIVPVMSDHELIAWR